MNTENGLIMAINAGSSSIKFALYEWDGQLTLSFSGELENIGLKDINAKLHFSEATDNQSNSIMVGKLEFSQVADFFCDWLGKKISLSMLRAIGHRVVYGMNYSKPELITPGMIQDLKKGIALDPEHLPIEIDLIDSFINRYPTIPQIACFDTSFHCSMPLVAKQLSIPRKYFKEGLRRFGFHGLSYSYIMEELEKVAGLENAKERVIIAHLGNGASLAAIKNRNSMDTSMGFTPASGIPMGTRTGDLDPGVASYLMQHEKLSLTQFNHLVNHESGLLGISETSSDMRELLQLQIKDIRVSEAIDFFCYQIKKWIGAYAAILGGLDTLIFSGGIGANSGEIRSRICTGLDFLEIEIDEKRNRENHSVISTDTKRVTVRVIHTNEELMIARLVCTVLEYQIKN